MKPGSFGPERFGTATADQQQDLYTQIKYRGMPKSIRSLFNTPLQIDRGFVQQEENSKHILGQV